MVLGVVCRALYPAIILPGVDIPLLLAVCLWAMLLERWLTHDRCRCWAAMAALSAATFGLLPLCAGMAGAAQALKLAAVGSGVFLVSCVLFDSMAERIASGPHSGAAYPLTAFLLFLAGQGLSNIFF